MMDTEAGVKKKKKEKPATSVTSHFTSNPPNEDCHATGVGQCNKTGLLRSLDWASIAYIGPRISVMTRYDNEGGGGL